jgi:hypothetical protein
MESFSHGAAIEVMAQELASEFGQAGLGVGLIAVAR